MAGRLTNSFAFRFLKGLGCLPRALGMILGSRRVFLLSALPFLICLALYVVFLAAVVVLDRHLVGLIIGPGAWWRSIIRWALMVTIPLAVLVISVFTYTAVCFVAAAPLYEWLSSAVERRLTGAVEEAPTSLKIVLYDIWRSLADAARILLLTLGVLVLGLIAPPVTTVLAALVSAVLLGLECCDYPMGRRRMLFGQKLRFARRHVWEMMGIGLPLLFALTVPFVGAVFLPLGVVGGTILFVDLRAREEA
jgi:CysZ protein